MPETAESKPEKVPEDLNLKMGTKDEAFWTRIKKDSEMQLEQLKNQIKFTEALVEMTTEKIKAEESKRNAL
jgi:hypothetical protein